MSLFNNFAERAMEFSIETADLTKHYGNLKAVNALN